MDGRKARELAARIEALDRLTDAKFITFRTLLEGQADSTALALASADKAVSKAEVATEKRFEHVNEFRSQLADQATRFATRESVELLNRQMRERVDHVADEARERTESLTNANRKMFEESGERVRMQLEEVKAQSTRLLLALMSTVVGTLIAALVVAWTRK